MSYDIVRRPLRATNGLGLDFTVTTPFGNKTIGVPIEQFAKDAATIASKQGMSTLQKDLIPALIPILKTQLVPVLQKDVLPPLLKQVEAEVTPMVAKIQKQVQPMIDDVVTKATVLGIGVALAVVGAIGAQTWYLRREIRRKG